jgi:hypothetical protein
MAKLLFILVSRTTIEPMMFLSFEQAQGLSSVATLQAAFQNN